MDNSQLSGHEKKLISDREYYKNRFHNDPEFRQRAYDRIKKYNEKNRDKINKNSLDYYHNVVKVKKQQLISST